MSDEFSWNEEPEYESALKWPYPERPRRTGRTTVKFSGTISDAFAKELVDVIAKHTRDAEIARISDEIVRLVPLINEDETRLLKRRENLTRLQEQRAQLEAKR